MKTVIALPDSTILEGIDEHVNDFHMRFSIYKPNEQLKDALNDLLFEKKKQETKYCISLFQTTTKAYNHTSIHF